MEASLPPASFWGAPREYYHNTTEECRICKHADQGVPAVSNLFIICVVGLVQFSSPRRICNIAFVCVFDGLAFKGGKEPMNLWHHCQHLIAAPWKGPCDAVHELCKCTQYTGYRNQQLPQCRLISWKNTYPSPSTPAIFAVYTGDFLFDSEPVQGSVCPFRSLKSANQLTCHKVSQATRRA